ncbi:MAG TPA: DUF6160 family protein [Aquabacterium sp.]|nr:DUF6160 family protein [Aquabacterium sp.]
MKVAFKSGIAALTYLSACAVAQAAGPLSDQDLRSVQGQDGVTLMGDLHIKTDAFVYTDTDANGGSISFNGIAINGMFVRRYDILRGQPLNYVSDANTPGSFGNAVASSMQPYLGESGTVTASSQTAQQMNAAIAAGIYTGGDVVQIAFPNAGLSSDVMPSFTVQSITMGHSDNSFGSLTLDKIDFQGTKRWLWPH